MDKQTARTLDQYKHESFEDLKQLDSEKLIKMRDRAGDLVNETNTAHREALLHWTGAMYRHGSDELRRGEGCFVIDINKRLGE